MPIFKVPAAGAIGVVKDLSQHELPPNAWTDASNMRFLDGSVRQFYGHGPVYGTPADTPLHVVPVNVGAQRYWLYASVQKIYAVTAATGTDVHTNLTRQTGGVDVNYAGAPNTWTSTVLSGIPILNAGNLVDPPQRWNLDTAQRCVKLDNWPDNTFCKALRTYKNFLVALHVARAGQTFPYMVLVSHPADPGGVPISWDPADATKDAIQTDLAEGGDPIIDGLQLRDSFMIYKEQSVWRMDFTGGPYVHRFSKVLGLSGAMNRNCIVEIDGFHFVLTGSDVVIHDGQSPTQVLDKVARRALFQDMDVSSADRAFVFKNPFLNEVFVCYPSIGNTIPNKAMVWNYKDRTVSYRSIPSLHHANYGPIDSTLSGSWAADPDSWDSDLTAWNGPDFTPNVARVLMAAAGPNLFMLDSSATFNGVIPSSYLERRGLSFGDDERVKTMSGVRLRVTGNPGQTVIVKYGGHMTDPYADPEWTATVPHFIGQTISCDGFASFRYPAIRIESGTAVQWRLDSYDFDIQQGGKW